MAIRYPPAMKKLPLCSFAAALALAASALSVSWLQAEDGSGWVSLFDGKTLNGWVAEKGGPPVGWTVQDGSIHRSEKGGNLHSVGTYLNFELEFEWKVDKGVNSGLKYRYADGVGPEYQVIDDENGNEKKPKGQSAALYAIKAAEGKQLNPYGQWNQSRIVAKGNHLEHWLNGKKVVEIEIGSPEWLQLKGESKFKDRETFGTLAGPIHLQDHGGAAWFRNLRIRSLD